MGDSEAWEDTESEDRVASGRSRATDKAKHKTGYNGRWEAEHPWLFNVDGEKTYCKLCCQFDTKNHQNQSKVWNIEACTTIRKDVLARHETSMMHREALEQERVCQVVKARGGIREAIERQVVLQRNAVIGAMKCLYWLCKQEIPHTIYELLATVVFCYKPGMYLPVSFTCRQKCSLYK